MGAQLAVLTVDGGCGVYKKKKQWYVWYSAFVSAVEQY